MVPFMVDMTLNTFYQYRVVDYHVCVVSVPRESETTRGHTTSTYHMDTQHISVPLWGERVSVRVISHDPFLSRCLGTMLCPVLPFLCS